MHRVRRRFVRLAFSFLKPCADVLTEGAFMEVCSRSRAVDFQQHGLLAQSWQAAVLVYRLQQWSLVMVHHIVSMKN